MPVKCIWLGHNCRCSRVAAAAGNATVAAYSAVQLKGGEMKQVADKRCSACQTCAAFQQMQSDRLLYRRHGERKGGWRSKTQCGTHGVAGCGP